MFWNKKKIWNPTMVLTVLKENILANTTIWLLTVVALLLGSQSVNADFAFGVPTNLGSIVNSSYLDAGPCLSPDGLLLLFNSLRPGGSGGMDIWIMTRETASESWGEPMNLGPAVNSSSDEGLPEMSADGLTLYFNSNRPGGFGGEDIYVTTRSTIEDEWGIPINLGPIVNSPTWEFGTSISADGLSLYFGSQRSGGYGKFDLWVTTRATTNDDWGEPMNLGPVVNSSAASAAPEISADGLSLFFACNRPGGHGMGDIWLTTRQTATAPWGEAVNLGPIVNSSSNDSTPSLSFYGSTLYFASTRPGGIGQDDLWQISILPVVDLNGDEITDVKDIVIMTEHWAENYSLCDIGPTPLGDGVVDVRDLKVLIEYIEPIDYTLIARWALDETEGMFAHNSVNGNDDYVMGGALWQPDGGMIDGALELDGIDDCIISSASLNLAEGPFSVVAWIKSGAPGQVIISQSGGYDWLAVDTEGKLMTELKGSDLGTAPLISQALITDGQWHRIGFVWDGSKRILYVDGVSVAEDMQDGLVVSDNGLYIGVGKNYAAGTFFSGLIDDVRIYKGVVSP